MLSDDLGLVPGNRVLLRAANNPMLVACWFAVLKAGGIAVTTMPLLRARELAIIIDKAQITLALCDERLAEELEQARAQRAGVRAHLHFDGSGRPGGGAELERRMAGASGRASRTSTTAADDVALIAFTSGTTGKPKGTMHFHRDVLAICDCFPRSILQARAPTTSSSAARRSPSPSGSAALVTFPMRFGASAVLLEAAPPDVLLQAIAAVSREHLLHRADRLPDDAGKARRRAISPASRKCVSAGEPLPLPTFEAWRRATGLAIIDGIGATEMLHIFISAAGERIRPGATGRPVPGYQAMVVDDDDAAAAAGRDRPARGARADRLPLPRRRAPAATTCGTAGTSPATPTWSTRTATSGTRRAPTT